MALTDAVVRQAKIIGKSYLLNDLGELALVISGNGSKRWRCPGSSTWSADPRSFRRSTNWAAPRSGFCRRSFPFPFTDCSLTYWGIESLLLSGI